MMLVKSLIVVKQGGGGGIHIYSVAANSSVTVFCFSVKQTVRRLFNYVYMAFILVMKKKKVQINYSTVFGLHYTKGKRL